jgi:conjugal transfer pilus assembly protein TraK
MNGMRSAIALAALFGMGVAAAQNLEADRFAVLPLIPIEEEGSISVSQGAKTTSLVTEGRTATYENHKVTVAPGVNHLVPVASGHLNRIVTPFASARVRTTADNATTEVSGGIVYVAPSNSSPISMYITESDDESTAISLTLVPRALPPRELAVSIDGAAERPRSVVAERWERSHPYEETLKVLLREVALGNVPQGYAIGDDVSFEPYCYQQGLNFSFQQALAGHSFQVAIGVVTNESDRTVEFREDSCLREQRVAAVAAWPAVLLPPGGQSEVYAVIRHFAPQSRSAARPSLISQTAPAPAASSDTPTAKRPNKFSSSKASKEPVAVQPSNARPKGWGVQVSAHRSERLARETVEILRSNGYPAEIYAGSGPNDGFLIVRLSGYKNEAEATRAMEEVQTLGYGAIVVHGGRDV